MMDDSAVWKGCLKLWYIAKYSTLSLVVCF